MSNLRVSEDIVTVSDFKAQASDWLRRIAGRDSALVITQNGRPAGVLLSPAAFDQLCSRQQLLGAIEEGMEDERAGRHHSSEEVFEALEQRIAVVESE